jgi:hypothetical protein
MYMRIAHKTLVRLGGAALLGLTLASWAHGQELLTGNTSSLDAGSGSAIGGASSGSQLANGWRDNSWQTPLGTLTYTIDTVAPHSGTASQRVSSNTGKGQFYTQFQALPGKRYAAKVWLRADRDMEVHLLLRQEGGPYYAYDARAARLTTSWQSFEVAANEPVGHTGENLVLMVVLTEPGTFWLDDASVIQSDTTQAWARTGHTIPRSFFGIHQHNDIYHDPAGYRMGGTVGAERLWDGGGAQLHTFFPTEDSLNTGVGAQWTDLETRIQQAQAKGTDLIMTIGGNMPTWASADPQGEHGCNGYGPGTSAPPKTRELWKKMVTALLNKAAGRIKYWEIWNEPYQCKLLDSRTPITVSATGLSYNTNYLVGLAADAYSIIKNYQGGNYQLQVISPSFDVRNLPFMDRYLSLGGRMYADILAVHAYQNDAIGQLLGGTTPANGLVNAPEAYFTQWHTMHNARNVLSRYAYSYNFSSDRALSKRPLWDTESGFDVASRGTYVDAQQNTRYIYNSERAAPYVARTLLLSSLAGLDRAYFYVWDRDGGGLPLATADATTGVYAQNEAGKAYETVARWLTNAKIIDVKSSNQVDVPWVVTIRRPTAAVNEYIVWNPYGSTVSFNLPGGMLYRHDLRGGHWAVTGTTVSVDGWMQLLTAQ